MDRIKGLVAWVQKTRAVRVFLHYSGLQGPILASGLAYQALFAIFAALWVVFSVAGLVVSGDDRLRRSLIDTVASALPGLIDRGSGGAIDPETLLQPAVFSWTGIIALVGLLVTALGFLASLRSAIRVIFELPQPTENVALQKLKDLGVGIGFGVLLIVSAALSFAGTAATGWLLGLIGVGDDSVIGGIVARVVTLIPMLALDAAILTLLYRVLSEVRIPWPQLRAGVLIGAVGVGALKVLFGAAVIGGVSNNPLLKSFAVILGLLIFFNFVCQVILIGAGWIAVTAEDEGVDLDPEHTEKRVADAQRLLREHGMVSGTPVDRKGRRVRIESDGDTAVGGRP